MFHSWPSLHVLIPSHVQRSVHVQTSNGSEDLEDKMVFFGQTTHPERFAWPKEDVIAQLAQPLSEA